MPGCVTERVEMQLRRARTVTVKPASSSSAVVGDSAATAARSMVSGGAKTGAGRRKVVVLATGRGDAAGKTATPARTANAPAGNVRRRAT